MKVAEVVFIVIAAAFPFMWTLNGDFVFDDSEAIVNNEDVTGDSLKAFLHLWKHDFWGSDIASNYSHKSYRPLTVLTFRLHKHIGGNQLIPLHFKITNLVIHIICSVLMYATIDTIITKNILKLSKKHGFFDNLPFTSTLLFTVHPVHVEVVSGIVGRADSLAAIFFFLCILSYDRSLKKCRKPTRLMYFGLSIVSCVIAMLFKESGITALVICVVYDIFVVNNFNLRIKKINQKLSKKNKSLLKTLMNTFAIHKLLAMRLIVVFISLTAMLWCRWAIMGFKGPVFQEIDNPAAFHPSFITRVLSYSYIYFLNVLLLLWPKWLCFDWSMGCVSLLTWTDPKVLFVVTFWSGLVLLVFPLFSPHYSLNSQRCLLMGLSLLIIPFLPASNIFFVVGFVLAERVLYIPSIGFCLLISLGFQNVSKKCNKFFNMILVLLFFSYVFSFGMRSLDRSLEWQNERLLFESGLEVCPQNAKVHYNIGKNAGDRNDTEKAEKEYNTAIELYPKYYQAMNNLANLLKGQKRFMEAEKLLIEAVEIKPDFPAAWMNLGIVYSSIDKDEKAEKAYLNALSLKKQYPNCHYNLGNLDVAVSGRKVVAIMRRHLHPTADGRTNISICIDQCFAKY